MEEMFDKILKSIEILRPQLYVYFQSQRAVTTPIIGYDTDSGNYSE